MLEDNRWEFSLGLSWRVKNCFFGIGYKETVNSIYKKQDGGSIYFSVDVDPTPRNQQKKIVIQESAPIETSRYVNEPAEVSPPVDTLTTEESPLDDDAFGDAFDDDSVLDDQNQENASDSNYVPSIPFQR